MRYPTNIADVELRYHDYLEQGYNFAHIRTLLRRNEIYDMLLEIWPIGCEWSDVLIDS